MSLSSCFAYCKWRGFRRINEPLPDLFQIQDFRRDAEQSLFDSNDPSSSSHQCGNYYSSINSRNRSKSNTEISKNQMKKQKCSSIHGFISHITNWLQKTNLVEVDGYTVHYHDLGWKSLMLINMIGGNDDLKSVGVKDHKNLSVTGFWQEAAMNGFPVTSNGIKRWQESAFSRLPSVLQQIVNIFGKLVDLLFSFSVMFFHERVGTTWNQMSP